MSKITEKQSKILLQKNKKNEYKRTYDPLSHQLAINNLTNNV